MATDTAYQETLSWLFEKLPMFSRLGKAALKPDLGNTLALCSALGNPQHQFKSVHIAGTNGKGSTSHALAAVLQQAGYKTGLYTSPHLIDFRERIRINGEMIANDRVVQFVEEARPVIDAVKPSFFEITVAMAFTAFAREKVDIAIIETGLGGRLDSTNVITPLLSVITNISFDHRDLLGDTLHQIAAEKAGIIKPLVPVIIGEQQDETERVFFEHALQRNSPLYYAQALWSVARVGQQEKLQHFKVVRNTTGQVYDLQTDLLGNYQVHNIKTVLTAVEILAIEGYAVSTESAVKALASVKRTTGLRGRWDWICDKPSIICDVAHNPAGLKETLEQWGRVAADNKHIVLGFVKDKDIASVMPLFPKGCFYYFCNAHIPRALPADELKTIAWDYGLNGEVYPSVEAACHAARANMTGDDALLITGSFFVVGEALEKFAPGLQA